MKIQEELLIIEYSRKVYPLNNSPAISIKNKDVEVLISSLEQVGFEVDLNNSEKTLEYKIYGETKRATVPFTTDHLGSQSNSLVSEYLLRNKNLELKIEDYNNKHEKQLPGVIGEPRYADVGVRCSLKFDGDGEVGVPLIKKVREKLQTFYHFPLLNEFNDIKIKKGNLNDVIKNDEKYPGLKGGLI